MIWASQVNGIEILWLFFVLILEPLADIWGVQLWRGGCSGNTEGS